MPHSADLARRATERRILIAGATALVLGVLFGLLILARGNDALYVDAEWMEEIVEHRHPWWEVPSRIMDVLGGGLMSILISLTIVTLLFAIGRRWTALYFAIATLGSTLLVQTLKIIFARARPEDILVTLDSGSFPSGHVANAATMATALVLITWRLWVVIAGSIYVVLMALRRTYLGAHWVSDTVGGLLIGTGVAIVVWAPFALRIYDERTRLAR
jgi:membrane-associated phospholipid phosphatase